MRIAARFIGLLVGMILVMVQLAAPASAAKAVTVTGYVTCINSYAPVGIWVDATSSTDGWAKKTGPNPQTGWAKVKYSFSLNKGGTYRLHVGCGGDAQRWGMTAKSSLLSGSSTKTVTCNDVPPWIPGWLATIVRQGIPARECRLK